MKKAEKSKAFICIYQNLNLIYIFYFFKYFLFARFSFCPREIPCSRIIHQPTLLRKPRPMTRTIPGMLTGVPFKARSLDAGSAWRWARANPPPLRRRSTLIGDAERFGRERTILPTDCFFLEPNRTTLSALFARPMGAAANKQKAFLIPKRQAGLRFIYIHAVHLRM